MTPSTLAPPAGRDSRSAPDPPVENRRADPVRRRRRNGRRVFLLALLASALAHVLFIVVGDVFFADGPPAGARAPVEPRPSVRVPEGMRAVELAIQADAPVPAQPEPEPAAAAPDATPITADPVEPTPAQRDATPAEGGAAPAADAPVETPPSAVDRLLPQSRDPRLWADVRAGVAGELSDQERVRRRVLARIEAYNDSMRIAAERERSARDWTYTDEEGRRWGISPGKIHLGGLTLPLPVALSPPAGKRDEVNARLREWDAMMRQRESVRDEFDDRVRAIRERRDAERDTESAGDS